MLIFLIVMAVLLIVALVVTTVFSRTYANDSDTSGVRFWRNIRWIVAVAIILISIAALVISGIKIIDSTEIGIVRTWGQIDHTIEAGLNLTNPISDTVSTYDLRVHVRGAQFASYTKDAQPITSSIEYQYQIDPAYVLASAKEYGTQDILESKLANVVEERAKIVFSKYSAMPLLENRSNLSSEVMDEVKELEELFHVKFTSVVVRDVDFSDAFEASVEAKMVASQEALRAEQEKQTALIKAQQEKETAIIKAEQERETAKIEAEAQIVAANAEAEALNIVKEALNNMPENWITREYLDAWNGQLPEIITEGSDLMINPKLNNE